MALATVFPATFPYLRLDFLREFELFVVTITFSRSLELDSPQGVV
jgi:hypothetical protein